MKYRNRSYAYLDYLHRAVWLHEEDVHSVPIMGRADGACRRVAAKPYVYGQFRDIPFTELRDAVCKLCDQPQIRSRHEAIEYLEWIVALDIQKRAMDDNCKTDDYD